MKETDIRVVDIRAEFTEETLRFPLTLSSGEITDITYAGVRIMVENRKGSSAEGFGGILLSDLWAFPEPSVDHMTKDQLMRRFVLRWRELLLAECQYADAVQLAHRVEAGMPDLLREIRNEFGLQVDVPRLAGLVAWSPFDAALHDGWAKAAGRSAYAMYTQEFLNDDLGHYLGPEYSGSYPGDFLQAPKASLWVQHVVGVKDPLTPGEVSSDMVRDELPVALTDWIHRDRIRWLKLKIKGADIADDLERILEVYRVSTETAEACWFKEPIVYAVDPNEGFTSPEPLVELLRKLRERSPLTYKALQYIEQPTPRQLFGDPNSLRDISNLKPLLADESLDDLAALSQLKRNGWNGVALKTCKGHTHALLTYCWAKRNNLYITVQDLTNIGISLVHSVGLSSRLKLAWDCSETNSRQYLPFSQPMVQEKYPELFISRDGQLIVSDLRGPGLY
ncbi:enolase C-terminal domain-like protein [Paenibacillus solisilvae]|uniref:Enolase C-terminal domain-like protein n=1 Tax=Paenibacillus solisilvae TaxID=2486751 RepID=A0ABW0W9R4_9BACL